MLKTLPVPVHFWFLFTISLAKFLFIICAWKGNECSRQANVKQVQMQVHNTSLHVKCKSKLQCSSFTLLKWVSEEGVVFCVCAYNNIYFQLYMFIYT